MNLDTIVATVGDIVQPIDGDAPEITIGLYQQAPDRPRLLDSSCSDTTNFPPDGRGPTHATEMSKPDRSRVIHLAEAEASLPGPSGERAITLLRRGSLDVKLSARPLRPNRQTPHTQDEVYVVVRGRGVLFP
ncbi:MAG: hypothetical protein DMF98_05045 [Acidobacteria bacterium]|nr:MAG: hypothetical protein DMF98_05045 [Acidobacteriota bacterium]